MKLVTKGTPMLKKEKLKATWDMETRTYVKANHPDEFQVDLLKGTFRDVLRCLENHWNIYETIGDVDSVVREYVFEGLANLMGKTYDDVWNMWVEGFKYLYG